jgi:hypothetical protein
MGACPFNSTHEEIQMIKSTCLVAAFAIAIIQPAFAQDTMMKCDDDSMMKMQTEMNAMTDPAMKEQKEMAMKEMDMAKEAMKAKKMDDCKMHMESAAKAMKK